MVTRTRSNVTLYVQGLCCLPEGHGGTSECTERNAGFVLDSLCFVNHEKSSNATSDVIIGPKLAL